MQLVIFVLLGIGIAALLTASRLFQRREALQAKREESLRVTAAGAGLYILGAVLFIVSTALYIRY